MRRSRGELLRFDNIGVLSPRLIVVVLPFFHSLKNANPSKQEQARLEVENAEDDLVQKTEVAITLMKTVLENVSPPLITVSNGS